ncbi:iron donor protein CyaY [Psychrobium sp. 1_MG-2023]|uniref:iron donor protein CyaY n=1 Tax=Psychrobium sp. 1_MG-2023 TaxID=3062624 RepID=UPI000C34B135|nr:iron donor protein CyaY [Psychrobium sp. 1_MG-2023]MDP2562011.1 iron donor protein CyaY [Psychrobium sp. 1_MG-2023]PKF58609.1 iron donor protein CyaY [Alteromonadales bacterium alter-6D02]
MNDSEFHQIVDDYLMAIEEALDDAMVDFDYETSAGVLKLAFSDGSQIIINRQEPLHQIWVATKFDGHHFELADQKWIDNRTGDELLTLITQSIERQSGVVVTLHEPT